MSRRRKWIFRLAAATLVPAAFFVLMEAGLRFFGYGYPTQFFLKIEGRDAYTTNQQFGWQFFPPAIARAPVICDVPARKAKGTYRIFVLGSSAAMGVPEPAFGFARMLEVMLRERYPDTRFEVVNTAMTAVNSHVVLPVARECGRHEPDLFIVYMGNNEVIGPYGPGTVLASYSSSLCTIRTRMLLRSTRTGQWIHDMFHLGTASGTVPAEWKGMEMFREQGIAADDPRLEKVYQHFRTNLGAICDAARAAGAKVVLATVAVNLKDCAPFASLHRPDLSESEKEQWEKFCEAGIALAGQGKHGESLEDWRRAAAIDEHFADLHFRWARSLLAAGQADQAREHFLQARNLDALRFRADTRINEVVRDVVRQRADQDVRLLDAETELAEQDRTQHRVPGREWFYEHVHFNPRGNYWLAAAVFREVVKWRPEWVQTHAAQDAGPPNFERCCERTALTAWDRYRMEGDMAEMTDRPPFTQQIDHEQQRDWRSKEVARQRAACASPAALEGAERCYLAAVQHDSDSIDLRVNFARFLCERKQYDRAIEQWRALLTRFPRVAKWHFELGSLYDAQDSAAEALGEYEEAARANPALAPEVHCGIGSVRLREGRADDAEQEFRRALTLNPRMGKAHCGLGTSLCKQGKNAEAIESFRKAIEIDPRFASAHLNLGTLSQAEGRLADALQEYRCASEADPFNFEIYHRLFVLLMKQGKAYTAIEEYRRMVRAMPDSAEAHFRLGSLLDRTNHLGEAVDEYEQALRIDSANLMAGHNLGMVLEKLKRLEEAVQQYRQVLQHHPDFQPARDALDRLQKR